MAVIGAEPKGLFGNHFCFQICFVLISKSVTKKCWATVFAFKNLEAKSIWQQNIESTKIMLSKFWQHALLVPTKTRYSYRTLLGTKIKFDCFVIFGRSAFELMVYYLLGYRNLYLIGHQKCSNMVLTHMKVSTL